ncbi:MAG: hypothetical protein ACOYEV_00825 [Candidatus Nanopelagicales bacterium]
MPERLAKSHTDWQEAEQAYAKRLKEITGDKPGKLTRKTAMELLELRGRANSKMDRYFKKALA